MAAPLRSAFEHIELVPGQLVLFHDSILDCYSEVPVLPEDDE